MPANALEGHNLRSIIDLQNYAAVPQFQQIVQANWT
jgi:hypothetical protein